MNPAHLHLPLIMPLNLLAQITFQKGISFLQMPIFGRKLKITHIIGFHQKKVLHNSTTEHIGHTGKHKIIFNDPYCGGEQSGKRAKSDATSTATNACAHTLA